MANWIQGHNDQFRFKAIVCHDGIFDTTSAFYETEVCCVVMRQRIPLIRQEVWFPQRYCLSLQVDSDHALMPGNSGVIRLRPALCSKSKWAERGAGQRLMAGGIL
jgi:hypothetical protein